MPDDLLIPVDGESPVESEELLAASGLAHEELVELVEFGVFETGEGATGWSFQARVVHQARRAVKLRDTFGLNPPGWPWLSPTWRKSRPWSSGCGNWSAFCPDEAWTAVAMEACDLTTGSLTTRHLGVQKAIFDLLSD